MQLTLTQLIDHLQQARNEHSELSQVPVEVTHHDRVVPLMHITSVQVGGGVVTVVVEEDE